LKTSTDIRYEIHIYKYNTQGIFLKRWEDQGGCWRRAVNYYNPKKKSNFTNAKKKKQTREKEGTRARETLISQASM
jgi:hypothetical protein